MNNLHDRKISDMRNQKNVVAFSQVCPLCLLPQ